MTVEVRRFRVGIDAPNAGDILDYAHALIERFGWNDIRTSAQPSGEATGFTLHDSIGEACTRLSAAARGASHSGGSKDWNVNTAEGETRQLRQEATQRLHEAILASGFTPDDTSGLASDVQFNDVQGRTQQEILDVLAAGRDAQ